MTPTAKEAKAKRDGLAPYDEAEAAKIATAIAGGEDVDFEVLDPEAAAREIVARILQAPDAGAVLAQGQTVSAEAILGQPFELREVRFLKSGIDNPEGPDVYAILDAVDTDTGERQTVTCGSRNVMAQALRLKQLGELPAVVQIIRADKPTAAGFYPMWLAPGGEAA